MAEETRARVTSPRVLRLRSSGFPKVARSERPRAFVSRRLRGRARNIIASKRHIERRRRLFVHVTLPAALAFPLAREFFIATIGPPHATFITRRITKRYFISMQRARTRGQPVAVATHSSTLRRITNYNTGGGRFGRAGSPRPPFPPLSSSANN